jgi:hypothetical protein
MKDEIFDKLYGGGLCTYGKPSPDLTMDIIMEAVAAAKAIPKNDQWVVVDAEGNIYKGTVEQVFGLVLKRHPLYKDSYTLQKPEFNWDIKS